MHLECVTHERKYFNAYLRKKSNKEEHLCLQLSIYYQVSCFMRHILNIQNKMDIVFNDGMFLQILYIFIYMIMAKNYSYFVSLNTTLWMK